MDKRILRRLDLLERQIDLEDYVTRARSAREFCGADVVICRRPSEAINSWIGNQPLVIGFQSTEPRRRLVVTEYSRELSHLFCNLRDIFTDRLDYVTKYDFFGTLAQAALDYLSANQGNVKCELLLKAVIGGARSYLDREAGEGRAEGFDDPI